MKTFAVGIEVTDTMTFIGQLEVEAETEAEAIAKVRESVNPVEDFADCELQACDYGHGDITVMLSQLESLPDVAESKQTANS